MCNKVTVNIFTTQHLKEDMQLGYYNFDYPCIQEVIRPKSVLK